MCETASARGAHTNRAGREFLRCRTDDLVSEGVGGIELSVLVEELFEPAERGADARDGRMQRGAFPLNDNNMSVSTSVLRGVGVHSLAGVVRTSAGRSWVRRYRRCSPARRHRRRLAGWSGSTSGRVRPLLPPLTGCRPTRSPCTWASLLANCRVWVGSYRLSGERETRAWRRVKLAVKMLTSYALSCSQSSSG